MWYSGLSKFFFFLHFCAILFYLFFLFFFFLHFYSHDHANRLGEHPGEDAVAPSPPATANQRIINLTQFLSCSHVRARNVALSIPRGYYNIMHSKAFIHINMMRSPHNMPYTYAKRGGSFNRARHSMKNIK